MNWSISDFKFDMKEFFYYFIYLCNAHDLDFISSSGGE